MKIGLVLANSPTYSETFLVSLIQGLQESGNEVYVFAPKATNSYADCKVILLPNFSGSLLRRTKIVLIEGLKLIGYPRRSLRYVRLLLKAGESWGGIFRKVCMNGPLLRANLDWLHFGFATLALQREEVAQAIDAKMAVSLRGFDINVYPLKYPGCYRRLWERIDRVHSISNYLVERAQTDGLKTTTSTVVIPPAVKILDVPSNATNSNTDKPLKILTVGRYNWIKGYDVAFRALHKLVMDGVELSYHIVGTGNHFEVERMRYLIEVYELSEVVILHGRKSHEQTLELMNQADLYLQPSLNEGFCNAVLEAQMLGKPVLASRVGGLVENVLEGETGWLFDVGSSEDLYQRIKDWIQLDPDIKDRITQAARKRVVQQFDLQDQKQAFNKFYAH